MLSKTESEIAVSSFAGLINPQTHNLVDYNYGLV